MLNGIIIYLELNDYTEHSYPITNMYGKKIVVLKLSLKIFLLKITRTYKMALSKTNTFLSNPISTRKLFVTPPYYMKVRKLVSCLV